MNAYETLMAADPAEARKLKTGVFRSKRLAEIAGRDEPVEVTYTELSQRKIKRAMGTMQNKDGTTSIEKSVDSDLLIIVDAVTDPPLRDQSLRERFGAATPKDLAEVLFGREISALSDAVLELSGFNNEQEDYEDDIKN